MRVRNINASSSAGKVAGPPRINRKKSAIREKRRDVTVAAARGAESEQERTERFKSTFTQQKEMDAIAKTTSGLPSSAFYGVAAAVTGVAAFAGYAAGSQAPSDFRTPAQIGGVIVGGAAAAVGAKVAKGKRDTGAGVEIWNAFVDSTDPVNMDPAKMAAINEKYGSEVTVDRLDTIKQAYAAYLGVLIPPGDVPLRGDEADKLRELLNTIGLPDEDAAACHIDVGRNLFRARMEVKGREAQFEELRSFQKLIYVSTQLFGEMRSQFLTPWVARFKVSPEQVSVAKRSGAKTVMMGKIDGEFAGKVPATAEGVKALRALQVSVKLPDADCAEVIKKIIAGEVESKVSAAIDVMKSRGSSIDFNPVAEGMDELIALSKTYEQLAAANPGEGDASEVVPGVGAISVAGTKYASNVGNDLLDLYKLYMNNKMTAAGNALTAELRADLLQLRSILNIVERKADDIDATIIGDMYTTLLRGAVKSGRLDDTDSPAAVLNELITQVSMPGEQAASMHESLYREKLEECVRSKTISDTDEAALVRTARLLCVPAEKVSAIDAEVKGRIFRSALSAAMGAGIDVFGSDQLAEVKDAKKALRITNEDAFNVLEGLAKVELVKMVNAARIKSSKLDNARELRSVVYFSNIILGPLIMLCKGEDDKAAAMKEIAETLAEAKRLDEAAKAADAAAAAEAAEANGEATPIEAEASIEESTSEDAEGKPASLAKADKAAADRVDGEEMTTDKGKKVVGAPQKEITVAADFIKADRIDTYKTYLYFCVNGDVVNLPMGGQVSLARDESEFARLSQLGDILGLDQLDVYTVHNEMAEQAFKSQAETLTGGGAVNKQTMEKLAEMAKKLGVNDTAAQKIIRGITNKRLVGNLQSMKQAGQLTLEKVLQMADQDIDVKEILPDVQRMSLYTNHIEAELASGTGAVDVDYLLQGLPTKLGLKPESASQKAETIAKGKVRTTMVQAVAYYRQKNSKMAIKYLNNVVACARVCGDEFKGESKWKNSEEVLDLFGMYCNQTPAEDSQTELGKALGLEDEEATTVMTAVKNGTFGKATASAGPAEDLSSSMF